MVKPGQEEAHQGYVVDVACLRTAPTSELMDRAAAHPTSCGLMGHCVESGYGLVDDEGRVHLLEPEATTAVVQHLLDTPVEQGLRLSVRRRLDGDKMHTVDLARADTSYGATGTHIQP